MSYDKYKDSSPEDTIERIDGLYRDKLGLHLKLVTSKRVEGVYSATLSDVEGMWNTCGKGTTELFCAASAFGESVEHLCNYFAYDTAILSEESNMAFDFEKYPDEELNDLSAIKECCPDMLLDMRQAYTYLEDKTISNDDLIQLWKKYLGREKVPFVPYYSVRQKQYVMVPETMMYYLCGSNGGAAGNTIEEAIGHACDEIMERFVKHTIYMSGLTPPDVPREYINGICPELIDVIEQLEKNMGYRVLVKDASLGKGYSVLAVLLINKQNAEYLVNFGAHPLFEIALERCLTELLQAFVPGRYNLRKNMEKWSSYNQKRANTPQNWITILKDDSGAVPDSFFAEKPSWNFCPWPRYERYCNSLGMHIQLDNLLSIAPDVYIHDSSYLGFPTYRVYVPTVSTSHIPFDEFQVRCSDAMDLFAHNFENGSFLMEEIREIESTLFNEKSFMNGILFRSLGESRFNLLHAAACYDLQKYDEAKKYIYMSMSNVSDCLIRKIEMEQDNKNSTEINHLLSLFYENDVYLFAKGWNRGDALSFTTKFFEKNGCSFSPRISLREKNIRAVNDLHLRLKKAMLADDRCEPLDLFFARGNT